MRSMFEILENLMIGIVSGVLSSALVTIVFTHRDKKEKQLQGFKDDVQRFHRWILSARNELEIAYKYKDISFLKRTVEDEPILPYFDGLSDESVSAKIEATDYIRSLVDKYASNNVEENQFKADMGKLFKYSLNALKYSKAK